MASEAVVSFVVGKLGDLLIEEARFLHGVHFQVELILREMRRMQHFLKDADAKQKRDERVKNWVAEIRQVSYEAEDVIDSFILSQVAYKRRRHGSQGRIKVYSCIFSKLMTRYKVGKEIQRIKLKISEISSSRLTYGIRDINEGGQDQASSSSQALHEHRRIFAVLEEPDVVGMQDDVKILKKQLINKKSCLCVVSIVGMGGSELIWLFATVGHNIKALKINARRHFDIICRQPVLWLQMDNDGVRSISFLSLKLIVDKLFLEISENCYV